MRPFTFASVLVAVALAIAPAFADAPPLDDAARATARALGYEGIDDYEHGRYPAAQEKLARAYAIVHVPTLGLWSARAMEKQGKLVEAGERYLEVSRLPNGPGDAAVQDQARATATKERALLLPRIPKLRVVVIGPPADSVTVSIDGAPIAAALFGLDVGVNPGPHDVEARGAAVVRHHTKLDEGRTETVTFELPPARATNGDETTTPLWNESLASQRATRLNGALALGVTGVVGLATGTIAGAMAASKWSAAESACPRMTVCASDEGHTLSREARGRAEVANLGFAIGGTALAGAAILWVLAPAKPKGVSVRVGVMGDRATVVGSF